MIGLLDFLGSKIDELTSTTDIEELVQEVVFYLFVSLAGGSLDVKSLILLDIASTKAEIFLPSPQAIHEYVVRRLCG